MNGGGRVETSAPALTSRCGYGCEMTAKRLLVTSFLATSGGTCIAYTLDGGMACGVRIVYSIASLGGRCFSRTKLGGQIGIGFGDRGDSGAVELCLRRLGQKVDGVLSGEHAALGKHGFVNLVEA